MVKTPYDEKLERYRQRVAEIEEQRRQWLARSPAEVLADSFPRGMGAVANRVEIAERMLGKVSDLEWWLRLMEAFALCED